MVTEHPHVEIIDGSPCVRGTRVPVRRLWSWHRRGTTIETILKRYPKLGPAKVLDALAFAYDNEALVEADLQRENDALERDHRRGSAGTDDRGPAHDPRQVKLPF